MIKRTQIILVLKRGFFVNYDELTYLTPRREKDVYWESLEKYYNQRTEENETRILKARLDLIEAATSYTYEEWQILLDNFVAETKRLENKTTSFRQAMSKIYDKIPPKIEQLTREPFIQEPSALEPSMYVIFLDSFSSEKAAKLNLSEILISVSKEMNPLRIASGYQEIKSLIIILPSVHIKKIISGLHKFPTIFEVEIFSVENLRFDPTEHNLQPFTRIASKEEVKEYHANGLNKSKCPRILPTDPTVNFLGIKGDQVFEYHRENVFSQISDTSFYARFM